MNEQFGKEETWLVNHKREWPRSKVIETLIKQYSLSHIAEIGVYHGDLGLKLIGNVSLKGYYLIDKCFRRQVYELLYKWPITKFLEMPSVEAAKTFKNNSLDLIFIDAEHTAKALNEDLLAWIPKVKIGGFITGHDYSTAEPPPYPGLNDVVDRILPGREIIIERGDLAHQRSCFIKRKDGNEKI